MNLSLWPVMSRSESLRRFNAIDAALINLSNVLGTLSATLNKGLAQIMSDFTNLNAAVTLEASEVQQVVAALSNLEAQVATLTAAAGSGDQAQIDAATTALNNSVDALKTALSAATPTPPSGTGTDTTGGGGSTPPADTTGGGASTPTTGS